MVYDADAHVEENLQTFASLEGKEEFFESALRITEGSNRAFWLIEGKVFPKLTAKGVFTFGTPPDPSERNPLPTWLGIWETSASPMRQTPVMKSSVIFLASPSVNCTGGCLQK